jgi:phenylpropionate dioxygenase-like ring-hydroxylating dioxygenase large terminal subunit
MATSLSDRFVERNAAGNIVAVDRRMYADEEIYRTELDRIFARSWVFVGLEIELPNPGDFRTSFLGEVPVVVVRDEQGRVGVFENVCIHRGATLVRKPCGNAREFTCLYHQWTYGLDGSLKGVALAQRYGEAFRREEHGLARVPRVECFAGLIFASYDASAPPVAEFLGGIGGHLKEMLRDGAVESIGLQRYHVKANWKLFIENTADAYHPPLLHAPIRKDRGYRRGNGTNHSFDRGHGMIKWPLAIVESWDSTQDLPLLAKSRNSGWNRVTNIFPNLMVLEIQDMLVVRQLIPRGAGAVDVLAYNLALAGESDEIKRYRAWMVSSQLGVAGVASLDDKIVMEAVQNGSPARYKRTILLRGEPGASEGEFTDEVSLRGFYEQWAEAMA